MAKNEVRTKLTMRGKGAELAAAVVKAYLKRVFKGFTELPGN